MAAIVPRKGYTAPGYYAQDGLMDPRLKMWANRRRRGQDLKRLYESKWAYYWQQYRAFTAPLNDPQDWWRENSVIPTVYKVIETLLPRYVLGMFNSPDLFTCEARNARSEQYEHLVESLLRQTLEDMRLFPKMYEALKYALIMGHAWGKVVWREEYEDRQVLVPTQVPVRQLLMDQMGRAAVAQAETMYGADVLDQPSPVMGMATQTVTDEVYNGPDFEWRTLDRIFPDPSGEYNWMVEDITTTLEQLEKTQRELGVYDEDRLDALRLVLTRRQMGERALDTNATGYTRAGTASGVAFDYRREPEYTEGIPEHYISPMRDGTGVVLWQCWGWVPPEFQQYKDTQWRLMVVAEGRHILRDDPSPTPDGRPPYFPIKSIIIPGRLYGESITNYIGPLAEQQSRIANMRIEEVFLGVWGQFLARKDSIMSDNQLLVQPGGIIQVEPRANETAKDTLIPLQRTPMLPEAYTEDQYRQTQAEHASFASDIFQGVSPMAGTTATEVERRLQQGGAPHVLSVMYNDYTVVKELLTRTWKWLQMRMPATKLVRLQGDAYTTVNIADIQIPIDITVGGGMSAMSKDARIQMDQELLQMAANPIFASFMKPDAILRKWMLDRGWKAPEAYIKTQEELMAEQQQAMMAQAQAAQGGPNGDMAQLQGGLPQDTGGALPAEAGPQGQANLPAMPDVYGANASATLAGGQLAPGGLVTPAV